MTTRPAPTTPLAQAGLRFRALAELWQFEGAQEESTMKTPAPTPAITLGVDAVQGLVAVYAGDTTAFITPDDAAELADALREAEGIARGHTLTEDASAADTVAGSPGDRQDMEQGMPLPTALQLAARMRCERDMLRMFGDAGDEVACLSEPVRCAIRLFEELERRIGSDPLQRMARGTPVPVQAP